jgi:hypothetical protein
MEDLAGFPYAAIEFGKDGDVVDRSGVEPWLDRVPNGADLFVMSHGWNNDMAQAHALYGRLAGRLRSVFDSSPPAGVGDRRFAMLGILWPSKRWAERALIPGGSANIGGDAEDEEIERRLDELQGVFDAPDADERLREARRLVSDLEDDPNARDRFVDLVRSALAGAGTEDGDDAPSEYHDLAGRELLDRLKEPVRELPPTPAGSEGGAAGLFELGCKPEDAAGGAAGLGFSLSGVKAAAERFLNLTTYYQMKARAGAVGAGGVNSALRDLRGQRDDLQLHLVGHSFGGRLVTAATLGLAEKPAIEPESLTLLQAAFSHFGFSDDFDGEGHAGFFRPLVDRRTIRGPIAITHSVCDRAVGYAYPLASRLAKQAASGLGDAGDRYGGIGRNGAQGTPEAEEGALLEPGSSYKFTPHRLQNLKADDVILNHSDICKDEVAYALLSAVAAAPA